MEEIVEFTELGEYLDLPTRTCSAGMMPRLALGLTTTVRSDVLLLDEWIAAGDIGFIEKAEVRASSFARRSSVVVVASHSEDGIRRLCNKALWFRQGEIAAFGDVENILSRDKGEFGNASQYADANIVR